MSLYSGTPQFGSSIASQFGPQVALSPQPQFEPQPPPSKSNIKWIVGGVFAVVVVISLIGVGIYFAVSSSQAPAPAPTPTPVPVPAPAPGGTTSAGGASSGGGTSSSGGTSSGGGAGGGGGGGGSGDGAKPAVTIKPRQTAATLTDCGYGTSVHGWYDMQNQGVKNDYCRYVGQGDFPGTWFSCALAGSKDQYTPSSVQYNPQLPHEQGGGGLCS